jgi:hypothetical protein
MSATQRANNIVACVPIKLERDKCAAIPERQMLQHKNEIPGGHVAIHDIVRRFPLGIVPLRRHAPLRSFAYPCACFWSVFVAAGHFADLP